MVTQLDRIKCRFLWQGTVPSRKKYSLVNWQVVCLAKEFGGLGILDLRQMNLTLLMKWWWKFQDPSYQGLWKTIITYKYYSSYNLPYSLFWKSIIRLDNLGQCSVKYSPDRQSTLKFWTDTWTHNCSLAVSFPQLFAICSNPNITLREVINSQGQ